MVKVLKLGALTPLSDFVAHAGKAGLRVLVTAPNRRGHQSVVVIDPDMVMSDKRAAANGDRTPAIPGEVACYRLRGDQVEPNQARPVPDFDI